MGTILKRNPSQALPLTKYLNTIRTALIKRSWGWKDYDIQFRLKKAGNPNLAWDSVDGELWLMYMVNFQKPKPTSKTPWVNPQKKQTCHDFNFKANCTRRHCSYLHICNKCEQTHPSVYCDRQSQSKPQSSMNMKKPSTQQKPRRDQYNQSNFR